MAFPLAVISPSLSPNAPRPTGIGYMPFRPVGGKPHSGGIDASHIGNFTGIGEPGKEEDIGNTIAGEDRNTDTTD
jgi:hypothetical protein